MTTSFVSRNTQLLSNRRLSNRPAANRPAPNCRGLDLDAATAVRPPISDADKLRGHRAEMRVIEINTSFPLRFRCHCRHLERR